MENKKKLSRFSAASLTYFMIIIGFILIRIMSYVGLFDFMGKWGGYILNLVLQVGLMGALPLFVYSHFIKEKPKTTLENYGIKKIKITAIAISIVIGIIVYVLNIGVATFFQLILSLLGYERSAGGAAEAQTILTLIANIFFVAVLPAIFEEITHRGMLVDGFSKLGIKKTILFSALLFGLTHLNVEQFFYATLIGVLLGFMTLSTGNIIPAMIVHFMNNLLNVIVSYLLATSKGFAQAYEGLFAKLYGGNFFVSMFVLFAIFAFLVLLLLYLVFLLFKETAVAELESLAEQEAKKQLRAELMEEEKTIPLASPMAMPYQIFKGGKTINVVISSKSLRHPLKQIYHPTLKEKAFFYASFAAAIFVTVSTFIWGLL